MTITRADALDVMTVVVGAHPRTAPRWHDDPQAAQATADVWAAMFNRHRLDVATLRAAVVTRAADHPATAPEPGEIIAVARQLRRDRSDREATARALAPGHPASGERRREIVAAARAIADRKGIPA